jgi:hypothetical protein
MRHKGKIYKGKCVPHILQLSEVYDSRTPVRCLTLLVLFARRTGHGGEGTAGGHQIRKLVQGLNIEQSLNHISLSLSKCVEVFRARQLDA